MKIREGRVFYFPHEIVGSSYQGSKVEKSTVGVLPSGVLGWGAGEVYRLPYKKMIL